MLFRFRAQQAADLGILDISRARRPKNITSVSAIPVCEKWRGQVLKEVSRKITKIQDDSLGDYQVRDLNDEINRLMREKHVWELQIRNLGGPNYMRGARVVDDQGREIPGAGKGYRYYGRARDLPGVKELFEAASKPSKEPSGPSVQDLRRHVDASYYGYNLDEEEGALLAYEAEKEGEAYDSFMKLAEEGERDPVSQKREEEKEDWEELPGDAGDGVGWRLPTMDEVQEELVDRKRRRLLDKLG